MATRLPFKFSFKKQNEIPIVIKGLTTGDDLQVDEQGRHLIFRTINGRVTPIRVSAEDFAEWLKDQNVNINPADQKTLREIDKELEIMERAAEYGGPALQKQYEDYFKQRRELYTQMASGYYQQALQNQAAANKMTVPQLQQAKQAVAEQAQGVEPVRRSQMDRRGWDSSFHMWVEGQDAMHGLTPKDDSWYYNRVYGILLSALIEPASRGIPLSQIEKDRVFSDEFIIEAMKLHYGEFFGGTGADPRKIVAAVEFMKKNFHENMRDNKATMGNFIDYWYKRMEDDFSQEKTEVSMGTTPVTEGVSEISEGVIPKELPVNFTQGESRALMGLYNKARGSKLHAAHRVLLHGMGRIVDSIPLAERVPLAVELSHPKRGLHAVHREGFTRAYTDSTSLGLSYDRETLLREALSLMETAATGSTPRKLEALKRMSLIMGMMDGSDVMEKNPGIPESQFNRKWHNSAVNAHRVKSEGPGILETILDDAARGSHTYTNQDLRLLHAPEEAGKTVAPVIEAEKKTGPQDIGDGYSFSGNKLVTPKNYTVEFSPTNQGYADITVTAKDGRSFDGRIYMPPIGISKMTDDDRLKYLDSLKGQLNFMIDEYEKTNPPQKPKDDEVRELTPEDFDFSEGTFRVPIFDFNEKLTAGDREFLGEVGRLVDEGGLDVERVSDGIFKIKNPGNNKVFTIMVSKANKKLVGIEINEGGKPIPHPELSIEGFMHALGYRETTPEKQPEKKPAVIKEPEETPIEYY
jgi:hypothetical protein